MNELIMKEIHEWMNKKMNWNESTEKKWGGTDELERMFWTGMNELKWKKLKWMNSNENMNEWMNEWMNQIELNQWNEWNQRMTCKGGKREWRKEWAKWMEWKEWMALINEIDGIWWWNGYKRNR